LVAALTGVRVLGSLAVVNAASNALTALLTV
jgi:hypothetical protein